MDYYRPETEQEIINSLDDEITPATECVDDYGRVVNPSQYGNYMTDVYLQRLIERKSMAERELSVMCHGEQEKIRMRKTIDWISAEIRDVTNGR